MENSIIKKWKPYFSIRYLWSLVIALVFFGLGIFCFPDVLAMIGGISIGLIFFFNYTILSRNFNTRKARKAAKEAAVLAGQPAEEESSDPETYTDDAFWTKKRKEDTLFDF